MEFGRFYVSQGIPISNFSDKKTFEGHSNAVYKVIFMAGQRQLVSAGGDGLVKVWTIKSGECDTTLDNHSDRVWSLSLARDEDILVSGGGDSVITFWQDTTVLEKEKQAKALEERVEKFIPLIIVLIPGNKILPITSRRRIGEMRLLRRWLWINHIVCSVYSPRSFQMHRRRIRQLPVSRKWIMSLRHWRIHN
jgi:WD40 repeat protein